VSFVTRRGLVHVLGGARQSFPVSLIATIRVIGRPPARPWTNDYLETLRGRLHYRVRRASVVEPDDLRVLDPSTHPTLTLIPCYPFWYVGPAPETVRRPG
jgi:hypothetical protein